MRTFLVTTLLISMMACTSGEKQEAAVSLEDWKAAREDYHMVMGLAYHPAADEGDLVPLQEDYMEMDSTAKAWKALGIPEELKETEAASLLDQLVSKSAELNAAIESGDDSLTVVKVTEVHDIYHALGEL